MRFLPTVMLVFLSLQFTACASKKPAKAPEAAAASAEIRIEQGGNSDEGTAGQLQTVTFAYDSSNLDSNAKNIMRINYEFLKANTFINIQIEGHADERGGRQYNLALGERRAKAIRDYLKALGIKSNRMSIMSWGHEKPIAEGSSEEAWSRNRRATFVITAL